MSIENKERKGEEEPAVTALNSESVYPHFRYKYWFAEINAMAWWHYAIVMSFCLENQNAARRNSEHLMVE